VIVFGIDPGVRGALVALAPYYQLVSAVELPIVGGAKRRRLDAVAFSRLFDVRPAGSVAFVEKQIAMPGRGAMDGMTSGILYGAICAVVELLGLPLVEVSAQEWQASMGGLPSRPSSVRKPTQPSLDPLIHAEHERNRREKSRVLAAHRKNLKLEVARRAVSECPALRGATYVGGALHDGIADAYWIARHGVRGRDVSGPAVSATGEERSALSGAS